MDFSNRVNKKIKNIARESRTDSESRAERRLWKILLSKRQTGERFVRQHVLGESKVAFFCPDLNLVVEIEPENDSIAGFSHPGYAVVRFAEAEIINQMEMVSQRMQQTIAGLRAKVQVEEVLETSVEQLA